MLGIAHGIGALERVPVAYGAQRVRSLGALFGIIDRENTRKGDWYEALYRCNCEHAGEIMKKVNDAVLLTTKKDGQVNAMTISWGGMAIEWGKPLFITYVRESRFTKEFLDATGEFTVNLPMGEFDKKITAVCGAKSGRDMDKVAELGLTLEDPEEVNVPGIRELPLTLECRVLFKQEQDLANLDAADAEKWYPVDEALGGPNKHTAYYAEIVAAYVIE